MIRGRRDGPRGGGRARGAAGSAGCLQFRVSARPRQRESRPSESRSRQSIFSQGNRERDIQRQRQRQRGGEIAKSFAGEVA